MSEPKDLADIDWPEPNPTKILGVFLEGEFYVNDGIEELPKSDKPDSGLWRNNPDTPEGKYLVKRRDGTVVEWPNFVLGARDPAAPAALRAYADEAERQGFNKLFVSEVRDLALDFEEFAKEHGHGDPDKGPHRKDDPKTIEEMRIGHNA